MKFACRNRISSALMPCGSVGVELRERLPRSARVSAHGVGVGLLLDRDDHGGRAHVAGVAALDLGREVDLRDLPQQDGPSLDGGHDEVAQVLEAGACGRCCGSGYSRACWSMKPPPVLAPNCAQRLLDLLVA